MQDRQRFDSVSGSTFFFHLSRVGFNRGAVMLHPFLFDILFIYCGMIKELIIGDKVAVMDKGLLMLQQFAPKGAKPNNIGYVKEFLEDGDVLIEFPIGDDDIKEHSQIAPYPKDIIFKLHI